MIRHRVATLIALALTLFAAPARADDEESTDEESSSDSEPAPSEPDPSYDEPPTAYSDPSSSSEPSSSGPSSDGIVYSNEDLDENDAGANLRSWFGLGYFRTAAQTGRGPAIHSDYLLMIINVAVDVNRHGYSLELTSRGINDFMTLFSRTFEKLADYAFVINTRHEIDHRYGAPLDGMILRMRFMKYVARGDRWRVGAGFVASDYFHIAGHNVNAVSNPETRPAVQESWFVTVGPHVRLDYMMTKKTQARFGTMVGIPTFDLADKNGARAYPVTSFVHLRINKKFYIGVESAVVLGVPDVFTQRHELQLGFLQ